MQQKDPNKDWERLPSKRIIPRHQESYPNKWLDKLQKSLENNIASQFSISLKGPSGPGHNQRISMTSNKEIHFFDSNYGAFEFTDIAKFRQFYLDLLKDYKSIDIIYDMFELKKLVLPNSFEVQSLASSLSGKFTTLLYGSKYGHWQGLSNLLFSNRNYDQKNGNGIYADDFCNQEDVKTSTLST